MILDGDKQGLLGAAELAAIETRSPEGISSQEILALFQERGVKLSEATFRKYVQLGLLPTSKRVGRKGKHRGSRGVYPVSVIRRINFIKQLMDEGLTLEEIRTSFLSIQNDLEQLETALASLFGHIDDRIAQLGPLEPAIQPVVREVSASRKGASALLKQIERIGSRLAVAGPTSDGPD